MLTGVLRCELIKCEEKVLKRGNSTETSVKMIDMKCNNIQERPPQRFQPPAGECCGHSEDESLNQLIQTNKSDSSIVSKLQLLEKRFKEQYVIPLKSIIKLKSKPKKKTHTHKHTHTSKHAHRHTVCISDTQSSLSSAKARPVISEPSLNRKMEEMGSPLQILNCQCRP